MRNLKWALPLIAAAMSAFALQADAATVKTIYDFCGDINCAEGTSPQGGLLMDASGTLYGTTHDGGAHADGTVYALVPNGDGTWTHQVLYSFCKKTNCADGEEPHSRLILDANGALYGTTFAGGQTAEGGGTVFRLTPNAARTKWKLKVLHSFCIEHDGCAEGWKPQDGLAYAGQKDGKLYDGKGPLYGIAQGGEDDFGSCRNQRCGLIYRLWPKSEKKWSFSVIYRFCSTFGQCDNGWNPQGELVVQTSVTILGTTVFGGAHLNGAVFKLAKAAGQPTWNESLLYSFCPSDCSDGVAPATGVALAKNGDIWGAATGGGSVHGTLFKIPTSGAESTVFTFCGITDCPDGKEPANLLVNTAGEVFGSTWNGGGASDGGVLYKQSGATHTTLYRFCAQANCADGAHPTGPLVFGTGGKIYGVTWQGGAHGGGTVYELTP